MVHLTRRDFVSRNDRRIIGPAAMAGIGLARGPAISFRGSPSRKEWDQVGSLQRKIARKISSGKLRSGLRISRLRQRWVDGHLPGKQREMRFLHTEPSPAYALYKNNRDGTFTDVTEKAGVSAGGYGQGVAVGDYNGDGWPDMYVAVGQHSIVNTTVIGARVATSARISVE